MKGKKGICLILCLILITALAPQRAAAVTAECVDGVWASVALTGGANKIIFSADSELEQQILNPTEQTPAQLILPEGAVYDAGTNTLSLTDFNAPTANLVLTMMGGDFKLRLAGSSTLCSIRSDSMGRGGSLTICGDGALELAGGENAILVRAGGAPDFVRVEPQARLTASSSGSVIRVVDSALSDGVIVVDTSDPQLIAYDSRRAVTDVLTDTGKTVDLYTLPGTEGLFGLEADLLFDEEGERIVYNVYPLGEKDADGRYAAGEATEQLEDISAYQCVLTPHDWALVEANGGAYATRARIARFTVSTQAPAEGGTLSVSQDSVARGGSVEIRAVPDEGFKLTSLTVNGAPVSPANGVYVAAGVTSDLAVAADFAAATPTLIEITPPAQTRFEVPAGDEANFVSEPFTASVTDGAGDPVGAVVRWSVTPETTGVSVDGEGRVTVSPAAASAADGETEFAVTAAVEGSELPAASAAFTLALEEKRAAEIHMMRSGEALEESDVVVIPAAGETTRQQYAAVVFDQYGSLREEEIVWSAGDWPAGVRRDGDTLTVSDACADGSSLVVTAAAASDSRVSVSVTVRFAAPAEEEEQQETQEDEPEETQKEEKNDALQAEPGAQRRGGEREGDEGGEGRREAPVITWPNVTLAPAEERVYGITWDELVTLSGGSATLEGESLTGSFAINKEGAALPGLSDSFKIIFSYRLTEEGELQTVESEAQAVALTPRPLDASMITLSPSETPYTGTAREPAVAVRCDGAALVSGTDFRVNSYSDNIEIGTGRVEVEGLGNYSGTVTKTFTITPIPGSSVTCAVTPCKPEDLTATPAILLSYADAALVEGRDYDLSLRYDIPARTGTATVSFKGHFSGTRILSFDLPNYLITEGAGSIWSKSTSATLSFRANGALVKFTELTIDGKTVPTSYYSAESGSTLVKIRADYLKTLTAGKHIVGVAYQDGKALAIFSVIDADRRGVITGDSNNTTAWIIVLAASLIAFGALAFAFVRSGRKKKKKKSRK